MLRRRMHLASLAVKKVGDSSTLVPASSISGNIMRYHAISLLRSSTNKSTTKSSANVGNIIHSSNYCTQMIKSPQSPEINGSAQSLVQRIVPRLSWSTKSPGRNLNNQVICTIFAKNWNNLNLNI